MSRFHSNNGGRRTKRRAMAVLMLSCALLLAACGNDGASPTASEAVAENESVVSIDDRPVPDDERLASATEIQSDSGTEEASTVKEPTDIHPQVVSAHNKLGLLIHKYLAQQAGEDENVFLSPLSISLALSMVYNGAAGDTAAAMAETLQWDELDLETINKAHRALLDMLSEADDDTLGVKLQIANSIWHRQGFSLRPKFLQQTDEFYRAIASELDFAASQSVDVINDWVSENTQGLIQNLIERLDEDMVMVLVNTVYFKGDWTLPFDAALTRDGEFTLSSSEVRDVPMMYRDGRFDHFAGPDFEAVRLPYGKDERLAMYVFLPGEQTSLAALQQRLSYENWNEWLSGFSRKLGEVSLPRIDVEYKVTLNDVLRSLGMGVAFDRSLADFSLMVPDDSPAQLSISDVIHQAVLKVDEEGTEAAAATSVGVRVTSLPMYEFRFTADRPFFIAIRDDATGALLFVGSIVDPS